MCTLVHCCHAYGSGWLNCDWGGSHHNSWAFSGAVSQSRHAARSVATVSADISFKRLAGFGFWSGAVMISVGVVALLTKTVSFITLGGILFIIGLILIAPSLIQPIARIFGRLFELLFARAGTGQLAEGNLSRQPSRAAVTASTTMIGLAILVMASGLVTSVSIGFLAL